MAEQDPTSGAEYVQCGNVKLKRLAPSDMVELSNLIRKRYRDQVQACAQAAGLSPEKTFALMLEAERMRILRSDIIDFIVTVEGQREAIRLVMRRATGTLPSDEDIDNTGIPLDQMLSVAADLGYFRMVKADQGGKPANPPEGGSQTGTGISSPMPSA